LVTWEPYAENQRRRSLVLLMRALDRALAVTDAALSEHHEP
jgi:hypothetical protein